MELSTFSCSADNTRLVKHGDTVYKVKVVLARDTFKELNSDTESSFHGEIEEVLRAVLFMVQENASPLVKKIQTQHFLVAPALKVWKTVEKLTFSQDGQELKGYGKVIFLNVSCRERTTNIPQSVSTIQQGRTCEHVGHDRASTSTATATSAQLNPLEKETSSSARAQNCARETGACNIRRLDQRGIGGSGESSSEQHNKATVALEEKTGVLAERNNSSSVGETEAGAHTAQTTSSFTRVRMVDRAVVADTAQFSEAAKNTSTAFPTAALSQPRAASNTSEKLAESSTTCQQPDRGRPRRVLSPLADTVTTHGHQKSPRVQNEQRGAAGIFSSPGHGRGRLPKSLQAEDISTRVSPGKARSGHSAGAGQQKSMQRGSEGHPNLRQARQTAPQSPVNPYRTRLQEKSSPKEDSRAAVISLDGGSPEKAGSRPERVKLNPDERHSGQAHRGAEERSGNSAHEMPSDKTASKSEQIPRENTMVLRSARMSPTSHPRQQQQQRKQNQPLRRHIQRSPRVSRSTVSGFDLRRSVSQARITLTTLRRRARSGDRGHYQLRQMIQRSTVIEEQRLESLAKNLLSSRGGGARQKSSNRQAPTMRVLRTFEQKDRHAVETEDIQEEQKLQLLASGQNEAENQTPRLQGNKRRGSLLQKWTGSIIVPVKRALKKFSDTE